MCKLVKGNNKNNFFLFSPGILLINLYQLTKFEAPSCDSFEISLLPNYIMTF